MPAVTAAIVIVIVCIYIYFLFSSLVLTDFKSLMMTMKSRLAEQKTTGRGSTGNTNVYISPFS